MTVPFDFPPDGIKKNIFETQMNASPDFIFLNLKIEPLSLIGLRVWPRKITKREMLWIESFWFSDSLMADEIRIQFTGKHATLPDSYLWGRGMDHDPCDWLMPTTQWKKNTVYRDFYGLRPPYMNEWDNGTISLQVHTINSTTEARKTISLLIDIPVNNPDCTKIYSPLLYRKQFPEQLFSPKTTTTWTADQIEYVTGGQWIVKPSADWHAQSVTAARGHQKLLGSPAMFACNSTLQRALHEGMKPSIPHVDRHDWIASHWREFTAGCIVSKPVVGLPKDYPVLLVEDTIKAVIELGYASRQRYKGDVIAVTGTTGKSTTCHLIKSILSSEGCNDVFCTPDNYNSRVGAISQFASINSSHKAAIIEVAQSALWMDKGPITTSLKPTISLITEIGTSQRITTTEKTATIKSKIFNGLTEKSIACIGDHLPHFDLISEYAKQYASSIFVYGRSSSANLRLMEITDRGLEGMAFCITYQNQNYRFNSPLIGKGNVNNILAALSVSAIAGQEIELAIKKIAKLQPLRARMELLKGTIDGQQLCILDDSHNAELMSMKNAISFSKKIETSFRNVCFIIGRIYGLDKNSEAIHRELCAHISANPPNYLFTYGAELRSLRETALGSINGQHCDDVDQIIKLFGEVISDQTFCLIKGSIRGNSFGDVRRRIQDLMLRK